MRISWFGEGNAKGEVEARLTSRKQAHSVIFALPVGLGHRSAKRVVKRYRKIR